MHKVIISSNGHKNFLSPDKTCSIIAEGIKKGCPSAKIQNIPIADGGEGTIDFFNKLKNAEIQYIESHDSLFRKRAARVCFYNEDVPTAVIEIAETAGSAILKPHERQTMIATSYGVGELIKHVYDCGYKRIIIGLGGSIVSDCGIGMAQAIGITFKDKNGQRLQPISNQGFNALSLTQIDQICYDSIKIDLNSIELIVLSDVDIELLGPNGQAFTFGPQKGANNEEMQYLERGFSNIVRVIDKNKKLNINIPLAGAAGGLGAGLLGFLNADLMLGAEFIAKEVDLENKIANSDIVIVGEGQLDNTTFLNKSPLYIANLAEKYRKIIFNVVGCYHKFDYTPFYHKLYSCFGPKPIALTNKIIVQKLSEISLKIGYEINSSTQNVLSQRAM